MSEELLYRNLGAAYTATANNNALTWSESTPTTPDVLPPEPEALPEPPPDEIADPEEGIYVRLQKHLSGSEDINSPTGSASFDVFLVGVKDEGGLSDITHGYNSLMFFVEGIPKEATVSVSRHSQCVTYGKLSFHAGNQRIGTMRETDEAEVLDDGIVCRIAVDNLPRGTYRIRLANMAIAHSTHQRLYEQPDGSFKEGTVGYHNEFYPNVPEITLTV